MFKKYFKQFNFSDFGNFIFELGDTYRFFRIRFIPDNPGLFSDYQLKHAAPYRDYNNREGFIWAWKQNEKDVRRVSFSYATKDNSKKIIMTINLNDRYISLDNKEGNISPVQIEEILEANITTLKSKSWLYKIKEWHTNPYIKYLFVPLFILILGGILLNYILGGLLPNQQIQQIDKPYVFIDSLKDSIYNPTISLKNTGNIPAKVKMKDFIYIFGKRRHVCSTSTTTYDFTLYPNSGGKDISFDKGFDETEINEIKNILESGGKIQVIIEFNYWSITDEEFKNPYPYRQEYELVLDSKDPTKVLKNIIYPGKK